jgi:hypothetical protein
MKRTLLTMMASSMLVFAVPAAASAAHGKHHHGARHASSHRRHAKGARLMTFAPATAPASGAPATPGTETTPANETAGTVTSFTNGVLTITLTDGTVVSGKVTEQTELKCTPATPPTTTGGDDQGGGDDQAGADEQAGSESGEHGGPSVAGQTGSSQRSDFQGGGDGGDGHDGNQGGSEESCTTAALVPTAIVREAELSLSSAGAVWEKVDLVK